jgi:predicted acylesterase/phospholipase RssA
MQTFPSGLPAAPLILLAAALVGLAGCVTPRHPVPADLVEAATVPGYVADIRFWGDDAESISRAAIADEAVESRGRTDTPDWFFLSISGGGSNGAFGAGLITGWTAAGTRPEFDIVTGISTGSLAAPFAFLGPDWDDELTSVYTEVSGHDIYRPLGLLGAITAGAIEDNAPLRALVGRHVTDEMVAEIASEHARGRRLLVGTTDLDADRPVVWDIGAIAASDAPKRRELIRDILVASSSIPAIFPPARIDVVADGQRYEELHVDGGIANQAFLFPANVTRSDLDLWTDNARRSTVYVIRNNKVTPEHSAVSARLPAVAKRSVSLLIKTQGIGDLYQMHDTAERVGVDFNAIWIPESFSETEPKPFDRDYMRAVYALGRQMAADGIPWSKRPPQ